MNVDEAGLQFHGSGGTGAVPTQVDKTWQNFYALLASDIRSIHAPFLNTSLSIM